MKNNTSDSFGRLNSMNLRFWGGWFLMLSGILIVLTMGCEKGALGVHSALVTGQVVDSENHALGVPNATVKMVSETAVGKSDLTVPNNFATTVTDAEGKFIFENVNPDNVLIDVKASGYSPTIYDQTVAVRNGSVTNVGKIGLLKISDPLPEKIYVKSIVLRDATTLDMLDPNEEVSISFNNQTFENVKVSDWQAGQIGGVPIELTAENSFTVLVRANPNYYLAKEETISGRGDIQTEILLEPVTYNILLRCTRVPDYIEGGIINVFAETTSGNKPPQVIATHTIKDLGPLASPNLPELITVPGLAMPVNLRVQVRGYEDEIVQVSSDNLPSGTLGTYRLDVNFLHDNSTTSFTYSPTLASQAGMLDNRMGRDVTLVVSGPDLRHGDIVSAVTSLPSESPYYNNDDPAVNDSPVPVQSFNNGPVYVTFPETAVGYRMGYSVTIRPTIPPSLASGSYGVSSDDPVMINPNHDVPATGLLIGVEAVREN
jgi:hypothetical protein